MKTIHIISHTHWDREWYLNSAYTNAWLVDFFDGLFAMLEKEPKYQFVLDGQTMLLEDYYVELRKLDRSVSKEKRKLIQYVTGGRIFMGPLYNQPDWQLVSEESLVKNLQLGHKIATEYGAKMNIGWLLDNFGQISQTPQILKKAGIEGIYVWRGVEMDPNHVTSEFLWESPDGTKLPAVYLLDSYRNGMRLAEYDDIFDARMKDTFKRLSPFATTSNLLMLNGYDQEIEPDDVLRMVKDGKNDTADYRIIQSNPVQYMNSIMSEKPNLQTLHGALYSGRFISVFPGVLSARMYLKQQNHQSEKRIEKEIEPLATMNWLTGGEYPTNHIDAAYKKLLMNQPHDSICGCSIDDVHKDMEARTALVDTLCFDEREDTLSKLTSKINTLDSTGIIVFNTSPYPRDFTFALNDTVHTINKVPAYGYKVLNNTKQEVPTLTVDQQSNTIENNRIAVSIQHNGTFDLFDKENNVTYKGYGLLEDKADSGDEYNYSYPTIDTIITSKDVEADISYDLISESLVRVIIRFDLMVPRGLVDNRKKRSTNYIAMPVKTTLELTSDSSVVSLKTDILNTAKNHIVSALFPTNINTSTSQAGAQFDVVTRDIVYDDFDETDIPNHVKEVIIGAREPKPNTIFPHREFVDLSNGTYGVSVLNRGLPEFTILEPNNTISLTLFRGVDWVAEDINSRLGDAGPKILTPDAQCLRPMTFEYAVYPHRGDYQEGLVVQQADMYNTPAILVETTKHKGVLPQTMSFVQINSPNKQIKVTGMKRSIDKQAVTLRLYNAGETETTCAIQSDLPIRYMVETSLLEDKEQPIEQRNIPVKSKEIKTLKLYFKTKQLEEKQTPVTVIDFNQTDQFTSYESVEYILEEELKSEIERANKLEDYVNTPDMGRTALEAQLSAILTRMRMDEKTIKDLGYKLNHARVVRRVWDYIKTYKK